MLTSCIWKEVAIKEERLDDLRICSLIHSQGFLSNLGNSSFLFSGQPLSGTILQDIQNVRQAPLLWLLALWTACWIECLAPCQGIPWLGRIIICRLSSHLWWGFCHFGVVHLRKRKKKICTVKNHSAKWLRKRCHYGTGHLCNSFTLRPLKIFQMIVVQPNLPKNIGHWWCWWAGKSGWRILVQPVLDSRTWRPRKHVLGKCRPQTWAGSFCLHSKRFLCF